MEKIKLLYECDPSKNLECKKTNCCINGGDCYNTTHEEYSMNYGTLHKEYIMTMAHSSNGKLKGGTRSYLVEFLDEDTGKKIVLCEQNSRVLIELLANLSKGEDWRLKSYEV